jgi:hypothetical protein
MSGRGLHDGLLGDLGHAARLLAEMDAADRDGYPVRAAIARTQLGITLDWMLDRIGHDGEWPCFFGPHGEYCPLEWDRGARADSSARDPEDQDDGQVTYEFLAEMAGGAS